MYLRGDMVAHEGAVWRSEHRGLNHWEPGSEGVDYRIWRDVTLDVLPPKIPDEPADPDAPAEVPAWREGISYAPGEQVAYNGVVYEVAQAHTSQADWTPDAVASLYRVVE